MKKFISACLFFLSLYHASAQTVTQKLQSAFSAFEKDNQLKYAISSLYVIDAETGKVVFDKNSRVGLAPASTQKIITSVTAFELLGKDYRYKTGFYFKGNKLLITPSGDPTFGSWRWEGTSFDTVFRDLLNMIYKSGGKSINKIAIDDSGWDDGNIPEGWIWQDIGNYYGAGAHKLNYRENQYDIILRSGRNIGDSVSIVSLIPGELNAKSKSLQSKLTSAQRGSGDNAYVFLPENDFSEYRIRGTIPVNENNFSISASITDPEHVFMEALVDRMKKDTRFEMGDVSYSVLDNLDFNTNSEQPSYTYYSPSLDSIVYWFNKKSVNLFEGLL